MYKLSDWFGSHVTKNVRIIIKISFDIVLSEWSLVGTSDRDLTVVWFLEFNFGYASKSHAVIRKNIDVARNNYQKREHKSADDLE